MTNKHRLLKINPGLVPALSQMARCSFRQTTQFASAGSTNAILGGSVARCRPGTPGLFYRTSLRKGNHRQPWHGREQAGKRTLLLKVSSQFAGDRRGAQTQAWDSRPQLPWWQYCFSLLSQDASGKLSHRIDYLRSKTRGGVYSRTFSRTAK